MKQGNWRGAPALAVAGLALFMALSGTVYAAKQARIHGKTIKVGSIPGNRVKKGSIPANRLKPGVIKAIAATAPSAPLTGADIDVRSLGQVPSATFAEAAGSAQSSVEAEHAASADQATNAVNAQIAAEAQTVNGHNVGCGTGTLLFSGACWEASESAVLTAPQAAEACADRGGELPAPLQLAAFAHEPGVNLNEGGEWSNDIVVYTGPNIYGVAAVAPDGEVSSALSSNTRAFRCVLPIVR